MSNTHGALEKDSPFKLLILAFPLILANITTPLLGLVDTAILGHMGQTYYLAGASIATLILTQLYWVCGFLKMSVTGLSAQAGRSGLVNINAQAGRNQENIEEDIGPRLKVLVQGLTIAFILGVVFIVLQKPILEAGIFFAQGSSTNSLEAANTGLAQATREYFSVRVWGAPAALANLALVGWLIGQQKTKQVLALQVAVNLINIILSLWFVFGLKWGISGVAGATLVAEYFLLFMSVLVAKKALMPVKPIAYKANQATVNFFGLRLLGTTSVVETLASWLRYRALAPLLSLNSNILFRNLALQFTLAFVTFTGARYGAETAATNAILMQFFALIALGLDGVANAVEALVGEHKGTKNSKKLKREVNFGLLWSSLFALAYACLFWLFGDVIISLLTDQANLQEMARNYLGLMILLPLIAHWCFLMDGVFVGLTNGRAMRDSMIASSLLGFFGTWLWVSDLNNEGLWIALLSFLACRGLILGLWYLYLLRSRSLV